MSQNIKNNHNKKIDCKLYKAHFYDFMLYDGNVVSQTIDDLDGKLMADFSNLDIDLECGRLYSDISWSGAVNSGIELKDIGFTGVDNGLINFKKDRITNEQFLKIWEDSEFKIESGDTRLFFSPITGNTQLYTYPMYLNEDENGRKYISLKGGFYQGFFKLDGFKYQVLPLHIDDEWVLNFELRPRSDYEVDSSTINHTHPDNKGFFFYMGTRAENKFWPFYKTNSAVTETFKKIHAQNQGYFSGCNEEPSTDTCNPYSIETYDVTDNPVVSLENDWLLAEPKIVESYFADRDGLYCNDGYFDESNGYFIVGNGYFLGYGSLTNNNRYCGQADESENRDTAHKGIFPSDKEFLNVYDFNPEGYCGCPSSNNGISNIGDCGCEMGTMDGGECPCEDYFIDGYYDSKCPINDNGKAFDDEAIGKGVIIHPYDYHDSTGRDIYHRGYVEFTTDNKFLLFDRTPSGFTINNWVEGTKVQYRRRQSWPNANYFMLMDRTPSGYTVHTIDEYNQNNDADFNILKDIRNNAFGLRIKDDGSIGYRYAVLDCDADNKYSIIEEYSKPNIVKTDEWANISVKFTQLRSDSSRKGDSRNEMRISIYVNGFLVFISKAVPAFNFKKLDENPEKQEAVPYNISLGGGSLGLMETILPNYYAITNYIMPIEKYFCGSFLGDIRSFKMYGGCVSYSALHDYLSKSE